MRLKDCKWVCVALALFCLLALLVPFKKPIESATYEQLTEICGIGEVRALMVLESGVDDVDDLYLIDGIGEKAVWAIKQKFY